MKILSILLSILIFSLPVSALDFKSIKKSVYKIEVLKKTGVPNAVLYSATGFFVNDPKLGNVLVTNNHVCDSMYLGIPIIVLNENGELHDATDFEGIAWIYLAPGMDVCIAKLLNQDKIFPALKLSDKDPKRYDPLTITGFDGEEQMLISEGYVYGQAKEKYFDHVEKVSPTTQKPLSAEYYMAQEFGSIPMFKEITQLKSTSTISPGYSGSPVLNDKGEVVGIANAYDPPTEADSRMYSYIFPVSFIKEALSKATLGAYMQDYFIKRKKYLLEWKSINNDVEVEIQRESRTW